MNTGKKVGLFVVGVLLIATVGAANVSYTVDRTALDADYVSDTAEEEGVYSAASVEVRQTLEDDLNRVDIANSQEVPEEIEVEEIDSRLVARRAVTEDYVASQSEQALRELYAYLNGESGELDLVIDTRPLKQNLADAIKREAATADAARIVESANTTQEIENGLKDVIEDNETAEDAADDIQPEQLFGGQDSFESEVTNFDNQINRVARVTGDSSESIKADFEQKAKGRIRNETQAETEQYSQNVTDATIDMQFAIIEAYTNDVSHADFTTRIDRNEQTLVDEVGRVAVDRMSEEVDDRMTLSQLLEDDQQGTIEDSADDAKGYVQQNETAKTVLPILALLLIAIAYGISRSVHATGKVTGLALLVAGIGGFIGATVAKSVVTDQVDVPDDAPQEVSDMVFALVDGVMGTLTTQSLILGTVGLVLFGVVYADENGHIDNLKAKATGGSGPPQRGSGDYQGGQPQGHQQHGQQQGGQPQGHQQPGQQQGGQQGGQPQGHQQGGQPQGHQQGGQPDTHDDSTSQKQSESGGSTSEAESGDGTGADEGNPDGHEQN